MSKKIERILFFFQDGDTQLVDLNAKFFPLGILLTRLVNEKYNGKKLKFINIYFSTARTYELYPASVKNQTHYYNGHMSYNTVFDFVSFSGMAEDQQKLFIWTEVATIMKTMAQATKNDQLFNSSILAFNQGVLTNLNPDYKVLDVVIKLFGKDVNAAVWINFRETGMYSKFVLEYYGMPVFEKLLDQTANGVEVFLEMYKNIETDNNIVIIKGRKDMGIFPLKIEINPEVLSRLN